MALLKVLSLTLLFVVVVRARLDSPPGVDKQQLSFLGRKFVVVVPVQTPQSLPQQQQQQDFDYYDAVARGLDNQDESRRTAVDGSATLSEAVVSDPDYETIPKVSQKHLETKKLSNTNPFNVQTPVEPSIVVESGSGTVDFDVESSGQEPSSILVDGETGPPSINPSAEFRPPIAARFTD